MASALWLVMSLSAVPDDEKLLEIIKPDEDDTVLSVDATETPAGIVVIIETVPAKKPGPGGGPPRGAGINAALIDPKKLALIGTVLDVRSRGGYQESSAHDPPEGTGARMLFPVRVESMSDGEGTERRYSWLAIVGGKLQGVLSIDETPSSGSGYPHVNETVTVKVLGTKTNGFPDIAESRQSDRCEDPDKCEQSDGTLVWRFDGKKYSSSVSGDPLIKSADASSFLVEKKLPKKYYAAEQAIDGVAETAWVEGVKGPGLGESLTLTLKAPTALASMTLLAGCGVNDVLWKKNHRLKKLKVSLDGAETEVALEDVQKEQVVPLAAKGPVKTVKLTIAEVYKGKSFDDACISEVRFTKAP